MAVDDPYCNVADVRSIMAIKQSELDDETLKTIIFDAMSHINSGLATMYRTPFNIPPHPHVPEKIRWMTATLAKCISHSREYDQGEPNETNVGMNCFDRIEQQLKDLRECKSGLVYNNGDIVPRIGECPDDSPGPEDYVPILSNTINDDAIFTLHDIKDPYRRDFTDTTRQF